jgi:large subunit ribosomal protein L6
MSRIGLKPIALPEGVTVEVLSGNLVRVKGPKGELSQSIHPSLRVVQENGFVRVERPRDEEVSSPRLAALYRSQHGLARTLIQNMVEGVSKGFEKVLEIQGVGYRASLEGKTLVLNIGFSHPVRIDPPAGIEFQLSQDERTRAPLIVVRGIDKQQVGQVAADIRKVRPPDSYKGKGIRYRGEVVKLKQGKRAAV